MKPAGVARHLRTVAYLKPSQILWRARYLAEKCGWPRPTAKWTSGALPKTAAAFPDAPVTHTPYPDPAKAVALLGGGVFGHLNLERQLGREQTDWCLGRISKDRLWVATLHCHPWALALAQAARDNAEAKGLFRHYLSDWISRCVLDAPGSRELAWSPYVVATRIGWWVRAYRLLGAQGFQGDFGAAFLKNLWEQAAFLESHMEWDLRANHLLRDAAGLAWAGRFFDGPEANGWRRKAARLAEEQASEQVLPDGGHFERSPMYHLQVMDDILLLALLLEEPAVVAKLREVWRRMAEYIAWVRHPDGQIPLLNDAALNGACLPQEMLKQAAMLQVSVDDHPPRGGRHFADTGIVVWHGQPWTVFFDVGAIGPDCQPGHAHADTLTVEVSFDGQRLFVDPGTYAYDDDERRRHDRSTAAHNTVCVDGEDSSEPWSIFRVGRRAYPREVSVAVSSALLSACASHSGYDHLRGSPRHTRRIEAAEGRALTITDRIEGRGAHELEGGLLLAPEWTAVTAPGGWDLSRGETRVQIRASRAEHLELALASHSYHPEFGRELQTNRLSWRYSGPLPAHVVTTVERA